MFGLHSAGGDFYSYCLSIDIDRVERARLRPTLKLRASNTHRSGFTHEYLAHCCSLCRISQRAHDVSGSALLHDDRCEPGVMSARIEQRINGIGQRFAGDIVNVCLEQHDRLTLDRWQIRTRTDHDTREIRSIAKVGCACTETSRRDGHGRHWTPLHNVRGQQRCAGWCGEFARNVEAVGRRIGQQRNDCRNRNRQHTVRSAHGS